MLMNWILQIAPSYNSRPSAVTKLHFVTNYAYPRILKKIYLDYLFFIKFDQDIILVSFIHNTTTLL